MRIVNKRPKNLREFYNQYHERDYTREPKKKKLDLLRELEDLNRAKRDGTLEVEMKRVRNSEFGKFNGAFHWAKEKLALKTGTKKSSFNDGSMAEYYDEELRKSILQSRDPETFYKARRKQIRDFLRMEIDHIKLFDNLRQVKTIISNSERVLSYAKNPNGSTHIIFPLTQAASVGHFLQGVYSITHPEVAVDFIVTPRSGVGSGDITEVGSIPEQIKKKGIKEGDNVIVIDHHVSGETLHRLYNGISATGISVNFVPDIGRYSSVSDYPTLRLNKFNPILDLHGIDHKLEQNKKEDGRILYNSPSTKYQAQKAFDLGRAYAGTYMEGLKKAERKRELNRSRLGLEDSLAIIGVGLIGSVMYSSFRLTGNVIGFSNSSSLVSIILLLIGLSFIGYWIKKKNK